MFWMFPVMFLRKIQLCFQEWWTKPAGQGDRSVLSGQIWGMQGIGWTQERNYIGLAVQSADLPPDRALECSSFFQNASSQLPGPAMRPLPQMGRENRPAAWDNNQENHS